MTRKGFTLLEVLVVLAIVGVAAAAVLPRIGAVRGLAVRETARRLADGVGLARERAILGATTMRLVLDVDGGRWRIGRAGAAADAIADDAPVAGTIPAGVRVRAVAVGTRAAAAGSVVVDLRPDGDALPVRIDLADEGGRTESVVLPPARARALVVDGAAS